MNNGNGNDQAPGQNKTYSIIVNGRPREVTEHKLTYLQVVQLAYPGEQPTEKIVYTVTFSNPHGHDGTLVDGQNVQIKNGIIFNVKKTDQS
ncbi:MAG: multiubiquitin domain-containing protein [Desulfobulbus sp.]|nr:multiubiquitin domain-containing protein [Desulfobulbus sp.]